MNFDSALITAYAIKADIGSGKTKEELDRKYSEFKKSNEKVYNNILTDPHAVKIMEVMGNVTKRIASGEITRERGDVEIGQFMASLYLPTEEQLSRGARR